MQWIMPVLTLIFMMFILYQLHETKEARCRHGQMRTWLDEVWNNPKPFAIERLMRKDGVLYNNATLKPMTLADFKKFHREWFKLVSNTRITILHLSYQQPWIHLKAQVNGTYLDKFFSFQGEGWVLFDNDGRLKESYEAWNSPSMLNKLFVFFK